MRYAVLFPGQGSQHVGMGADVFAGRPEFLTTVANDVLGWDLEELCRSGPEEELTRTDRAQPAIYAVSVALWEAFRAAVAHPPVAAAGHSLGEYTALTAAGVIDAETGLRLVATRGAAMARAGAAAGGSMAALIGATVDDAERISKERRSAGGRLWVANINAPGQIVVAGASEDIDFVVAHARDLGVRRAIPLKVSGAFHCPLMAPAEAELDAALARVTFAEPEFPVFANATAEPVDDVRRRLREQLSAPVRFAETLEHVAAAGAQVFVHVGPGNVTAGMASRTVSTAEAMVVSNLEEASAVAQALSVQ